MRRRDDLRRTVIGAMAASVCCAGALVVGAPVASAAPVGLALDYTCAVATGPGLPVRVDVTGVLPDEGFAGVNSVPYLEPAFIDVDLELGASDALGRSAVPGGLRLDGDSTATLAATFVGPGGTTAAEAALAFAPTRITPSGGSSVKAAGGFPGLTFHRAGAYDVHLGDLELSLRVERADGTPLGTVTATCAHDPAAPAVLGTLVSEPVIVEHPIRPSALRVTEVTPTSAALTWHAVPWWFDTRGYEVYVDGEQVAFVHDKQATITNLAPDSQHRVKIVTRDVRGLSSPRSQGLVFTTPPTP
ncbi:fibronectin type III domain-containing protein [Saccharothrix australiensis]|nr:fibronectin type III domain-containing protein [Saccharothrix australiensis]